MTKINNHCKENEGKKIDNSQHFSVLLSFYHGKFRLGKWLLLSSFRLSLYFILNEYRARSVRYLVYPNFYILLFPFSAFLFLFRIYSIHLLPPTLSPNLPPFPLHPPVPG